MTNNTMDVYCPCCGENALDVPANLTHDDEVSTSCGTCMTWLEVSREGEDMVVRAGP